MTLTGARAKLCDGVRPTAAGRHLAAGSCKHWLVAAGSSHVRVVRLKGNLPQTWRGRVSKHQKSLDHVVGWMSNVVSVLNPFRRLLCL